MLLLGQKEKRELYSVLTKYDKVYPELGDALSRTIQNKQEKGDLLTIFNHLDPEQLDFEDFAVIDDAMGFELEILVSEETEEDIKDVVLKR